MFLDSDRLEAFFVCSQTGHFGRAANRLGITQSALSQRIAKLEQELGKTLLIRESRNIRLTSEGAQLLQYCLSLKDLTGEFADLFSPSHSKALTGSIRLAGYSSITRSVLLPTLGPLLTEHPGVHVDISSREFRDLPQMLHRGEVDYIVTGLPQGNARWEAVPLGVERFVWVRPKKGTRRHRVLDHDAEDATSEPILRAQKKRPPRDFVDDIYGIIDSVRLGLGSALIPRHLAQEFRESKKFEVKATDISHPITLHFWKRPYHGVLHHLVLNNLSRQVKRLLK